MARIRSIKPEFFTSLDATAVPRDVRLTFIGLWTHVDDDGRCADDARLLKGPIWPLDDDITPAVIEEHLRALDEASLIVRYEVDGRRYLAVTGWHHQKIDRKSRSKLPAPPGGPDPNGDMAERALVEDSPSHHRAGVEASSPDLDQGSMDQGSTPHVARSRKEGPAARRDWRPEGPPRLPDYEPPVIPDALPTTTSASRARQARALARSTP